MGGMTAWSRLPPALWRCPRCGMTLPTVSLRADDRPLGRKRDAALAWDLQHLSEVGVAEKTDVGIIQRHFRDYKHAPEAAPGIDEEYLGGLDSHARDGGFRIGPCHRIHHV